MTNCLPSIKKRFSKEIAVGVWMTLSLLGTHSQDIGGLLVIRLAFVKHLCQPVFAVILRTKLRFVAFFNAVNVLPRFDFFGNSDWGKL